MTQSDDRSQVVRTMRRLEVAASAVESRIRARIEAAAGDAPLEALRKERDALARDCEHLRAECDALRRRVEEVEARHARLREAAEAVDERLAVLIDDVADARGG